MNKSLHQRPAKDEYFEYYETYVGKVPDNQCLELLNSQVGELEDFFAKVTEEESLKLHSPYTWTIKQVVGHLIDAERIFADRLHRFSCGDMQPQPGMDQNPYVDNQDYVTPSLSSLVEELVFCRKANLCLIRRLKVDAGEISGTASGCKFTVRSLVWILAGHIIHHMNILKKRVGQS